MGYRDEGEAALQRVQNLEDRVSEKDAENRALADKLAQANAEIVRLQGKPVHSPWDQPVVAANVIVYRALFVIAGIALLLLCFAAYGSERAGMQVSIIAIPFAGAAISAWLSRRKPTSRCIAMAFAGFVTTFFTLVVFFGTVWRHL